MTLDTLITIGIVVLAAVYLYRKLARQGKGGGCASGDGCCGGHNHKADAGCCGSRH